MSEIFENAIVEKRNLLNELRNSLHTPQELRLFSIYLSRINPYDKNTRYVRFQLSDFQKIMEFGRLNIAQLKETASSILASQIFLPKESGGFKGINLFEIFDIDKDSDNKWYVEISATDAALPFIFDFKDRYFKYKLWNALRLKSANQIRMYEILKQYESIGKREIEVKQLQDLLGVNYPRWNNFKARVLDPCQAALKEITDIYYTYERGRTGQGGKWITIIFHIYENKDYIDQFTFAEYIDIQQAEPPEHITLETEPGADQTEDEEEQRIKKYGSERIAILAEAVNDEFTRAQLEYMDMLIKRISPPKDPNLTGSAATMYGNRAFLREQYAAMNAEAEKKARKQGKPIQDRAAYLTKMLEKIADQKDGD